VPVGGIPGFAISGPPRVAPSTQTVFVDMSGGSTGNRYHLARHCCATGGATLTIRDTGFQGAAAFTINGKPASVTFKDAHTLLIQTPRLNPGPPANHAHQSRGETVSLDAAITAN
jgi:hypothetical protein